MMKLTKKEVALLSDRERALLETNGPWQVKPLVQTIKRVRALRDRAADLRQRQTIANRQGRGSTRVAAPNERSDAKLAVLEKALAQLRQALESIDAESTQAIAELRSAERGSTARGSAASRAAAGKAPKASKTAVTPAPRKSTAAAKSSASKRSAAKSPASASAPGKSAKPAKTKTSASSLALTKPKRAKAPEKLISSKARQPLVRSLTSTGAAPPDSGASRRTRARKSRKG